jgi:hypothetical protein
MNIPQEKFAIKYLFEGNLLLEIKYTSDKDIEELMEDCHLKFREGKSFSDLRNAFWGHGANYHQTINNHMNWSLERADKVFMINWNTFKY